MTKCPNCGSEATKSMKSWNYRKLVVKFFSCSKCQKNFKAYYKDGILTYTIPKGK